MRVAAIWVPQPAAQTQYNEQSNGRPEQRVPGWVGDRPRLFRTGPASNKAGEA